MVSLAQRMAGLRVFAALVTLLFAAVAQAQQPGGMGPMGGMHRGGGMGPMQGMHGGGGGMGCPCAAMHGAMQGPWGIVMVLLGVALLASIITALIALAVYLVRRSRVRAPATP